MNYLAEILAFNNWIRYNSAIKKSDICLWHSLMFMANRFGWKEFNVPILTLLSESKLTKNDFYKSRNKLKQFGLIDFKERGGNKTTIYKIKSVVSLYGTQNDTQTSTQIGTQSSTQTRSQSGNLNKTRNQKLETKNKKERTTNVVPKKKAHGEFANVFLTDDELRKLKARFNDYQDKIEGLSSYIESSGKKYQSHYATILTWARKDKTNGNNNQKHTPKACCTEYDE